MGAVEYCSGEIVRKLRIIRAVGPGLANALRATLERIEDAPGSFEGLDWVPPEIATRKDVCVRKAKVISHKHNYRILFFHWKRDDGNDLSQVFDVFPRQQNYRIDWEWAKGHVGSNP